MYTMEDESARRKLNNVIFRNTDFAWTHVH